MDVSLNNNVMKNMVIVTHIFC